MVTLPVKVPVYFCITLDASEAVRVYVPVVTAFEKRVERLEREYELAVKAQKVREAIREYDLELYTKRARQNTVELEMFSDRKGFDKFV